MTRAPVIARWVLGALLVCAGCGSGAGTTGHLSLSATRSCLLAANFRVVGGPVGKQASNGTGAVGELDVTAAPGKGAFIAFYPSTEIADRTAPRIAKTVARLRGSMVRRDNATAAIVGIPLSTALRRKLLDCLR